MPCSVSNRSLAALHLSGSPTRTGTIWVSLGMTGSAAALSSGSFLMSFAFPIRRFQVTDGGGGSSADGRRQGGRKDESRRIGTHRVDQGAAPRNVSAHAAECLGERAFQHVNPVHHAVALRYAGATRAVHADGVHLVRIGHGAIALSQIADAMH